MPPLVYLRTYTYPPCAPHPPTPLSPPCSLWPHGAPVLVPSFCGGGGLRSRPPVSPLSPLPLPPPLLHMFPLPLAPRICQACCVWVAGAWPLCGTPPSGKLTILATMALACSSGDLFPPKGGGAPYLTSGFSRVSPPARSTPLCMAVWGICRSWGLHRGCPPSPVSGHEQKACAPAGGVPPPALPCLCPPPSPASHALSAHTARGVPPLPPLVQGLPPSLSPTYCARGAHAAVWGGSPLLLSLAARWVSALPVWGVPLSPLRMRVVHAAVRGVPLLLLPLVARWVSARPVWGGPLAPLPARGLRALLGGGSPVLIPPVSAR